MAWLVTAVLAATPETYGAGPRVESVPCRARPLPDVVTALCRDRTGLLWIGSRDGLLLFDGQSARAFEHDATDPSSISDNAIRAIYEDSHGDLWVGTNTGGLNRLDRGRRQFEHFRHDPGNPASLSNDSVYAIVEDRGGALWIGTQVGLNRLDPKTRTLDRFLADPDDPRALKSNYIYSLYGDTQGRLWVGTLGGGLARWEEGTRSFTSFRADLRDPRALSDDRVTAILEDPGGTLWVGTAGGLHRMDQDRGSFRRVRSGGRDARGASGPLVKALAPGGPGRIWVGTHADGMQELDLETGALHPWAPAGSRRHALGSNQIEAIQPGPEGDLWIGTWGGGLRRLSSTALLLREGSRQALIPSSLEEADVTGFLTDRQGGVWFGATGGRLLRIDPAGRTWHGRLWDEDFRPGSIFTMAEDAAGRIWVGTSDGLARLQRPGKTSIFRHDPHDPSSLGPGYVRAVMTDRQGRLWVGTGEGGVQRLDSSARVLTRYLQDPDDANSLSDNYVTALHEDRQGIVWIGTRSGGLNSLEPTSGAITRFLPDGSDPESLSHHTVTALHEDRLGRLWVATAGGGVNVLERRAGGRPRFRRITEEDGLVDNDVMAILEDDDGSLWLSTRSGLARFDPTRSRFVSVNVSDGLPTAEFQAGSAGRSSRALYFGSVKGPVAVPAGTPFPSLRPSAMILASLRTSAGEVHDDAPAWSLDHLEIPYGEWLAIDLAVLDFAPEHKHRYAYRLEDEWVDLGSSRAMTFTGLRPGTHVFSARGRNAEGLWSPPTPDLTIEVRAPFWMTIWFRGAATLTLLALGLVGHRVVVSSVERRNRELLRLHYEREHAQNELNVAYERLRLLAQRLEAAKESERQRIARELHDDLGPSLTAVIINLQLLSGKQATPAAAAKLRDTIDVADRLVQRVRDLSLDLRPPLLEELGLPEALRAYLEIHAKRAGLRVPVEIGAGVEDLPREVGIHAFRVVQEAVTNVIRHAGARNVHVRVDRVGADLMLSVRDDGKGFDVRRTMESTTSRALGLLGMNERVHSLGGEITVDSESGSGTEVRARIPLGSRA